MNDNYKWLIIVVIIFAGVIIFPDKHYNKKSRRRLLIEQPQPAKYMSNKMNHTKQICHFEMTGVGKIDAILMIVEDAANELTSAAEWNKKDRCGLSPAERVQALAESAADALRNRQRELNTIEEQEETIEKLTTENMNLSSKIFSKKNIDSWDAYTKTLELMNGETK